LWRCDIRLRQVEDELSHVQLEKQEALRKLGSTQKLLSGVQQEKTEALRKLGESQKELTSVQREALLNREMEKREALRQLSSPHGRNSPSHRSDNFSVMASVEDTPYIAPHKIESRISGRKSLESAPTTDFAHEAPFNRASLQEHSHGSARWSADPAAGSLRSRPTSEPVVSFSVSRAQTSSSAEGRPSSRISERIEKIGSPTETNANQTPKVNRVQAGVGMALVNNGHGAALSMVVRIFMYRCSLFSLLCFCAFWGS